MVFKKTFLKKRHWHARPFPPSSWQMQLKISIFVLGIIYLCYMREIESVAEMCEELNCLFCFVNLWILRGKSLNSYLGFISDVPDVPDILKKLKQTSRLHPTCQLAIVCQSTWSVSRWPIAPLSICNKYMFLVVITDKTIFLFLNLNQ